jgi:hypothetical protein
MSNSYTKSSPTGLILRGSGQSVDLFGAGSTTDMSVVYSEPRFNVFNGERNPFWRQQIRDVVSATTPANGVKYAIHGWEGRPPSCIYSTIWIVPGGNFGKPRHTGNRSGAKSDNYGGDAFMPLLADPSVAEATSAYNRAIEKLYDKLNYFASTSKIGEDLGEVKQTLRALRKPLPHVRAMLNNSYDRTERLLNGWGSAVGLAGALADTHLEFAFGWKPLANSIAEATVALRNRDNIAYFRDFHAKGESFFLGSTTSEITNWNIVSSRVITKRWSSRICIFQGVWEEKCTVPRLSVNRVLGLTPKDVLPTIWNLIPYSFLVDYFTNIGTIANSISVPWGGVRWCNETYRTENFCENHCDFTPNTSPNYSFSTFSSTPGLHKTSLVRFTRSKRINLPLPELELTKLSDITGRQWLNMAALAVSQSAKLALSLGKAVEKAPDLPKLFIKELGRRGGYKDPYPYHRK